MIGIVGSARIANLWDAPIISLYDKQVQHTAKQLFNNSINKSITSSKAYVPSSQPKKKKIVANVCKFVW